MGTNYNPQIVTSGLVLALDAANPKSYFYQENLIANSNTISGFTTSNITKVLNSNTAPNGTLSAIQIIEDANTTPHSFNVTANAPVTLFLPYTASIYAKANSRTCFGMAIKEYTSYIQQAYAQFDVANNVILTTYTGNGAVINNVSITPVGNGWSRCVLTVTVNSSSPLIGFENRLVANTVVGAQQYNFTYTGDGVSNMYFWGPQLQTTANVTPYIVTTGIAAPKSNTWTDLSLFKNDGVLSANTPSYSGSNGSIIFSGFGRGNSSISLTNNIPSNLSAMTVEVLVNPAPLVNQSIGYIIGQRNSVFRLMYTASTYDFVCATSNNAWYSAGTTLTMSLSPVYNVWRHVTIVYDGTNIKGYINGVLNNTSSGSITGTIVGTLAGLFIMNTDAPNLDVGAGQLAIAKIYNRALSETEIQQNFNAVRGRYGL
jgi:hypothetical protein